MRKLSEILKFSRTNRPDEWSMDDYARQVEKLEDKIKELEQAIMLNCYDDVSTSSKRLMSLVTPLNKIEVTKNMNMKKIAKNKGYRFASLLAMTLYENYYMKKPDAVAFELLDTTAGVVSQIDNMLTGVIDEKAEAIRLLKVENETLTAKLRDDNEALKAKDKRIAELEKLCGECADYIDINRCLNIGFNSVLHKLLRKQAKGGDS